MGSHLRIAAQWLGGTEACLLIAIDISIHPILDLAAVVFLAKRTQSSLCMLPDSISLAICSAFSTLSCGSWLLSSFVV